MAQEGLQPSDETLETGVELLQRDLSDAYSFLGIQVERMEIDEQRLQAGKPVPEWSDAEASDKILKGQRPLLGDLKKYTQKGFEFARNLGNKIEPEICEILCENQQIKPEIKALESDAKTLLNYISSALVGVIVVNLPAGLVSAAASIATVIAVIIIKNKIEKFCQSGAEGISEADLVVE